MFACRHCQKCVYECQRETYDDREMRRADNIRKKLGWTAGIANLAGGKPKGMHWRTYERLKLNMMLSLLYHGQGWLSVLT